MGVKLCGVKTPQKPCKQMQTSIIPYHSVGVSYPISSWWVIQKKKENRGEVVTRMETITQVWVENGKLKSLSDKKRQVLQ